MLRDAQRRLRVGERAMRPDEVLPKQQPVHNT
jgi:hypothetical protein